MSELFIVDTRLVAHKPPALLKQRAGQLHEHRQFRQRTRRHNRKLPWTLTRKILDPSCIRGNVRKLQLLDEPIQDRHLLPNRINQKRLPARFHGEGNTRIAGA